MFEHHFPEAAMHHRRLLATAFAFSATSAGVLLTACARDDRAAADSAAGATTAAASTAPRTLYDRLGGKTAITAVIDSFVARVAADTRINKKFARSDIPRVKAMLVDQVCAASGGPCTYSGRDMKTAHRGMGVTEGEFDALVEDLVATLNSFNVGKTEQDELLAVLGSMKADIVERAVPQTGTALPSSFKTAPPMSKAP
jgi:hemoglobin